MRIGIGLLAVLCVFAGYVSLQPDTYHVVRHTTIDRSPQAVFAVLRDFHLFREWSPWERLDPDMNTTITGTGVGSSYEWHGNSDVGNGRMVITEEVPPTRLVQALTFLPPWEADAVTGFDLTATESGTEVAWWMNGEFDFMAKVVEVFIPMDSMIGGDYENGLANLKTYLESTPAPERR